MKDKGIDWPIPPAPFILGSNDIHVWAASLGQNADQLVSFARTLSSDEQERSARFRFVIDRERFIAGRGLLRAILARYLFEDPSKLTFGYNRYGKPFLVKNGSEQYPLHFNLTHSEDLVLFAITSVCAIGIDVEKLRPFSDAKSIAVRFFSQIESNGLGSLPENQQSIYFFKLWTRKEAWLKASGNGISKTLNQVEVSFLPNEQPRILRLYGNTEDAQHWSLLELLPTPNFIGALAVPAKNVHVSCWRWQS